MPTHNDETLHDRYTREHLTHLARLATMTPDQIAAMELDLHNALAEVGRLRVQRPSQGGEAVAWRRRDEVMGCKRFMMQKCYDAQSPQMKGNYEPFYCAHCKADQVADDLTMVKVSRELLVKLLDEGRRAETWAAQDELRALLAKSEGGKK